MTSSFRFSRYDPAWKDVAGAWPAAVWTEVFDVVGPGEPLPVAYRATEDILVQAAIMCLGADAGNLVTAQRMEVNNLARARLETIGAAVAVPRRTAGLGAGDVDRLVRASLRGQIWCELQANEARCAVGHEMYVHVQVGLPSRRAKLVTKVKAMGLFAQTTEYPWDDE